MMGFCSQGRVKMCVCYKGTASGVQILLISGMFLRYSWYLKWFCMNSLWSGFFLWLF